jgi:phosphate transport system substrate-binding protein
MTLSSCQQAPQETPTKGNLNVYVSDSHLSLVAKQADVFLSLYSEAHVNLLTASTRECLVHLLNDSVRMVFTDRALNAEERQIIAKAEMNIEEVKVAIHALGVLVNHYNKTDKLSVPELVDIIDQKIDNWNYFRESDLSGPIHLVTTGKNSGSYELLKNTFLKHEKDFIPDVILNSQAQVLEYVAKSPQAVGIVSLACFKEDTLKNLTEMPDAKVRPLAFNITDSTGATSRITLHQAYVYRGDYPLRYPLYVYFNRKSKLAAGFSAFIASRPGQTIIHNWGLGPTTMPVRLVKQR